jgi:hypothetical protein
MDALHWWRQGDAVTQGTALLLLAMSVASWVVILWKARVTAPGLGRRGAVHSGFLAGAIAGRCGAAFAVF